MWGARVRFRSPENVLTEIAEVTAGGDVGAIWFVDDTFTLDRERVERICDGIIAKKLDIKWFCEARVDTVDRDLLERMSEAVCSSPFAVPGLGQRLARPEARKTSGIP